MNRRSFFNAMAGAGCVALAAIPAGVFAQPSYKVSAEKLQEVIAQRFPARYPVGDLFNLDLQAPGLRLWPELNRLGVEMTIEAAGPALRRIYRGAFDVDLALRYEASDQSIRAHDLRVHSFRVPGLPPQTLRLLDAYGQVLAQQLLLEVVLHRLSARDLALADAMGLQPGRITVVPDGLLIAFVAKQGQ